MIVMSVDGRGSTGRGDRFLHAVQRQLGTVDVIDQLEAIRYYTNTCILVIDDDTDRSNKSITLTFVIDVYCVYSDLARTAANVCQRH